LDIAGRSVLTHGQKTVERQDVQGWGKAVVEQLADLRMEFPGVAGFSIRELWHMRQFYHWSQKYNRWLERPVGGTTW
jgi:hypothetical protein